MIQTRQLMLRYSTGKIALSGITLSIARRRFVYLTGESGAGKSSLLRCLYGGVRPTSGQLTVQQLDLKTAQDHQVRKLRRDIGIIFQDHRLLFSRTVFENVALPLRVQGWKPERLVARARKVLGFVGLEDRLWSFPEALSGGEQQRVAIARAMSTQPPLILADEPTGNLDIETARHIMDYLMELNRQGSTVVMATHDLQLMETHPGDIVRLRAGTLVEELRHVLPEVTEVTASTGAQAGRLYESGE
ncbi:MAG: ATP-binding cassette domain-containing protein [Mariprofundaceae bacterium]|nr:ATP-binding cassette domain-containing protein [Mariprofundaceae bacterium]